MTTFARQNYPNWKYGNLKQDAKGNQITAMHSVSAISLTVAFLAAAVFAHGPQAPYSQDFTENYNVLKFLGNGGPYNTRRGLGISLDTPEGCSIDQISFIMRHGERYPDPGPLSEFEAIWGKLEKCKGNYINELEFLNKWEPYVYSDSPFVAEESTAGPYAGLLTGYHAGSIYARRYGHLWNRQSITPIFASGSERIVDTARRFVEGFFGYNFSAAAINIIPEVASQGANTLVTICNNASIEQPDESACSGKGDYPPFYALANKWNKNYGLNLTWSDISKLCLSTAYELNVRGESPWVKAIPQDVWVAYEHQLSSSFWCSNGPGSPTALARGSNWVNATRQVLLEGPEKSLPLVFTFAHETDIAPILAFLGIDAAPNTNTSYVQADAGYHLSDVVPMGSRLVLERLVCTTNQDDDTNSSAFDGSQISPNVTNANGGKSYYIRAISNDAVVPLNECQSGPGYSCPLQEYSDFVDRRLAGREFSKVCNLTEDAPRHLDFFWNYNTTTGLNRINETISYQAYLLNYLGQSIF